MKDKKKARWVIVVVWIIAAVLTAWIGGDIAYSTLTKHRFLEWEKSVERDGDGLRLGARAFTVGHGDTALLMVHGFGDSPAVFRHLAPALAERGYACRAMRLPGFGEPMAAYGRVTDDQWMEAIESELEALRSEHARVWVVAHSLGAAITLRHILSGQDHVDGLVLLAPLIRVSGRRSPLLPPATWYAVTRNMLTYEYVESVFPMDVRRVDLPDYPRDRFVPRNVYDAMFETLSAIAGRAADVRQPLLMMLAGDDPVIDTPTAEAFFKAAGSDTKRVVLLEDVGHAFPVDRGWERVVEEIDAFVLTARGAGGYNEVHDRAGEEPSTH